MSLTPEDRVRNNELGRLLEDIVGAKPGHPLAPLGWVSALEQLKRVKVIRDWQDLRPTVDNYVQRSPYHGRPDFSVELTNGSFVDIECKNLKFRLKPYVRKLGDTPYWAITADNLKIEHRMSGLKWSAEAKRIFVVSTTRMFHESALAWCRHSLSGLVEASTNQVTEYDENIRNGIALDLYELFEKWIYQ